MELLKEGLIQSARAGCKEILRQNAARFRRNNCVYFKKSQQNYDAKFPQNAEDALNQCFLKWRGLRGAAPIVYVYIM